MGAKDSVDRHIAFWRRELPTAVDPRAEGIITRMQVLVRQLRRRREVVLKAHGLEEWEYGVLWQLRSVGSPYSATPTWVAGRTGTHPATLTSRLDRLERAGYVTRAHDPADRRRLLVTLTTAGHRAWESVIGEQAAEEHALLADLSRAERRQLDDLLRSVCLTAEREGAPLMAVPDHGP